MSTLTATSPVQTTSGYLSNVSRAAWALVHALFAVTPRASTAGNRVTARDLCHLYDIADRCDSTLPNLAQELRMIGARGC
jgi:hypothetical protein